MTVREGPKGPPENAGAEKIISTIEKETCKISDLVAQDTGAVLNGATAHVDPHSRTITAGMTREELSKTVAEKITRQSTTFTLSEKGRKAHPSLEDRTFFIVETDDQMYPEMAKALKLKDDEVLVLLDSKLRDPSYSKVNSLNCLIPVGKEDSKDNEEEEEDDQSDLKKNEEKQCTVKTTFEIQSPQKFLKTAQALSNFFQKNKRFQPNPFLFDPITSDENTIIIRLRISGKNPVVFSISSNITDFSEHYGSNEAYKALKNVIASTHKGRFRIFLRNIEAEEEIQDDEEENDEE